MTEEEQPDTEMTAENQELETLRKEASDYKNKYLLLLADSENARKRLQKERQELIDYAMRNLIVDFLHPIDHLENAVRFSEDASEEVRHWALGFKMIVNQFKDVLSSNGVKPIESIGKPFDPHVHEAVELVTTADYPPGVVIEENIKGYAMGDKVIRPARVKVSKSSEEEVSETNQN